MSPTRRLVLLVPALAVVAGVLVWGYTGLPSFGSALPEYGTVVDHLAQGQRHVTNFVAAVMFDYRGMDTLVEEFILFTAVLGLALLLRSTREVDDEPPHDAVVSEALRTGGGLLAPVLALFGLWVIAFGYVTPGGGFQGGVMASAGALMLWVAGGFRIFRDAAPASMVDAAEGLGAAAYVGVGLVGLGTGASFLSNVLPLGSAGSLASGGTIAALNWIAGIEVAGAFVLIYREFTEEYTESFTGTGQDAGTSG